MNNESAVLLDRVKKAVSTLLYVESVYRSLPPSNPGSEVVKSIALKGRMILASYGVVVACAVAGVDNPGCELVAAKLDNWLAQVGALRLGVAAEVGVLA